MWCGVKVDLQVRVCETQFILVYYTFAPPCIQNANKDKSIGVCYGLNCGPYPPKNSYAEVPMPVPEDVILLKTRLLHI